MIPEAEHLYQLLFGKQRQGVRQYMAVCDMICMYWKKQNKPLGESHMLTNLKDLILDPGTFEWFVKARVGERTLQKVHEPNSELHIEVCENNGRASFSVVNTGTGESFEDPEVDDKLDTIYRKYILKNTPALYAGLDSVDEKILLTMGHQAEIGGL